MVIGSLVGLYSAAFGVQACLRALKETGDWNQVQHLMIDDEQFFDIVGLDRYAEAYRKYDIR
jgi:hypothetical protein